MKKIFFLIILMHSKLCFSDNPSFIDGEYLRNPEIKCIQEQPEYTDSEKKLVRILWDESIKYLEGYVKALTTSTDSRCLHSSESIVETNTPKFLGPNRQCVMDNTDMQVLVKHVYAVINNKEKAFKCFTPQKDSIGLYSPSRKLEEKSPVAQWLNRKTLGNFYSEITNEKIKNSGLNFYNNFHKMVTGNEIQMPKSFPFDISATSLPNLWASVGWVPMYAEDNQRALNAGDESFRGGYAYAEVMGHWGLLQIESINNEPVGAEIGMTVQAMGTFYPYHFHNIQEIYYTIREPVCRNSIKQFLIGKDNKLLTVLSDDIKTRTLEFNGSKTINVDHYWVSTTPRNDELLYIPRNSIHAFNLKENCEPSFEESAHVTIWARSMSHEKNNDYGTTHLCSLKDESLPKKEINSKEANVVCKQNKHIY